MKTAIHTRSPVTRYLVLGVLVAAVCFLAGCKSMMGPKPPPVTVSQIIEMTKAGVTPQQIIDQIHASKTVYRMQATELIKLKEEGVADDVINYMQQTYLDSIRDDQPAYRGYYPPMGYYGYGYPYYYPHREIIVVEPRHHHPSPQKPPKK